MDDDKKAIQKKPSDKDKDKNINPKNNKNLKICIVALIVIILAVFSIIFIANKSKPTMDSLIKESINETASSNVNSKNNSGTINSKINGILQDNEASSEKNDNNVVGNIKEKMKDKTGYEEPTTKNGVEIKKVESSDKLILQIDGKLLKTRLIGVASNGSKAGLEKLLKNHKNLSLETDIKEKDGDYTLIYLWNGLPDDNGNNMINIQMIKNKYARTTYDQRLNKIEAPNIKYMGFFVDLIKS